MSTDRIIQEGQQDFAAEMARREDEGKPRVMVGDQIFAEWPGSERKIFPITFIREDEDGIMCAVFGKDGVVGAEAIEDLRPAYGLTQRYGVTWIH